MTKKKIGVLLALILYVIWLLNPLGIPYKRLIYFNYTESLPTGIYIAIPSFGLRNFDTVAFAIDDNIYTLAKDREYLSPSLARPYFIKKALVSGHHYEISEKGFYLDHNYVGSVAQQDNRGRPLPHQEFGDYIVPEGKIIAFTPHPQSFDSRYFGPVDTSKIETRVIPLLTFPLPHEQKNERE